MNAREILDKVEEFYACLETYQDTGYVEDEFAKQGDIEESGWKVEFKTYFQRPLFFRFEWTDGDRKNIVWSNESGAFAKFHNMSIVQDEFRNLIAGATGVSIGSAHNIPRLLIPEVGGRFLAKPEKADLSENQEFEGTDCYCINADYGSIDKGQLFVSRENFSIVGMLSGIETIPEEHKRQMETMVRESGHDISVPDDFDFRSSRKLVYLSTKFDEPVDKEVFQVPLK